MNPVGQRILIFGDSLSHRGPDAGPAQVNVFDGPQRTSAVPGDLLASHFLAAGAAAARLNARVGRSAVSFWAREDTAGLLAADRAWRPTVVIVNLGTNDIGQDPKRDATAMTRIRDAYRVMGAEVFAIGPPSFARNDLQERAPAVVDIIRRVFGASRFVDGRSLSADLVGAEYRSRDQVHFQPAGAAPYAARLAAAVTRLGGVQSVAIEKLRPFGMGVAGAAVLGAAVLGIAWIVRRRQHLQR